MITLHDVIFELNPSVKIIRGENAFDINERPIAYNKAEAEARLIELQSAKASAKASALVKLTALGLTQAEVTALVG